MRKVLHNIVLAGCLLVLASPLAFGDKSPAGRELLQGTISSASSSSRSSSANGGAVTTSAQATATNGGRVAVRAEGVANGRSRVNVNARGKAANGGTTRVDAKGVGTGGSNVNVDATGTANGPLATSIVKQFAAANGNAVVAAKAIANAIQQGNGPVLALVLKDSFAQGTQPGQFATEVVSVALADAISQGPAGTTTVAKVVASATAERGESAKLFARSLGVLLAQKGCPVLKPVIVEADNFATIDGRLAARGFIEAINVDVKLIECGYEPCLGVRTECCTDAMRKIGRCQCANRDPLSCKYRVFWQTSNPGILWECTTQGCPDARCICPHA